MIMPIRLLAWLGKRVLFTTVLMISLMNPGLAGSWGPYRGMTAQLTMTEQDIVDFAALGGNLLRVGFARQPLMRKEPPYDFDEDAFAKLDRILDWCETHGVRVVIDPHTVPGTARNITTVPSDELWKDYRWHELAVRLWSELARREHHRGAVLAGYNLLNEPGVPTGFPESGPGSWNELAGKLIAAVRRFDPDRPLIVEPPVGRPSRFAALIDRMQGMKYLAPPSDPHLVYSPHVYVPQEFTHQGVSKDLPSGLQYPGKVDGVFWDKAKLRQALEPVREFQRKYNVPIYIGEFSAANFTGDSGNRYLRDLIDLFEEYGWSWTYHAWRSAPVWDAEMDSQQAGITRRSSDTPRLQLLREAFRLNNANR